MNTKVCTKCKEEKPLTEFHKDSSKKDGMQIHCKSCRKQHYQENREHRLDYFKRYRQENREQRSEYNRQWRQENREQMLDYFKRYRQENREQRLEYEKHYRRENRDYFKRYRQENREQRSEYNRQWRQENREKVAALRSRRRALKRNSVPDFLKDCPAEKQRLVQIHKLRDLLTEATGTEHHVDHIWPLSKGGPHWSGNLQIITAEENLSKGDSMCEETARVIQESLDENTSPRQ